MRMHSALTQRGVSPAPVILATLEMVSTAQVSSIAAFPRMKRELAEIMDVHITIVITTVSIAICVHAHSSCACFFHTFIYSIYRCQ